MTLVTRLDLTETSPCTPGLTRLSCGLLLLRGKTTTVGGPSDPRGSFSSVSDGASRHGSRAAVSRLRGGVSRRVDDVTRRLPAGRHVYNRGSPTKRRPHARPEERGCHQAGRPAYRWSVRAFTTHHCGQHRCRWGSRCRDLRRVIATRRAAMVSAMALPGTPRDPLRSHSFTQCRSALAHDRREEMTCSLSTRSM
jgi:hypothetical protein